MVHVDLNSVGTYHKKFGWEKKKNKKKIYFAECPEMTLRKEDFFAECQLSALGKVNDHQL
jgi:hypothetical protein